MQKRTKVAYTVFKTDAGEFVIKDKKKVNRMLDEMSAGEFKVTIERAGNRLSKMKKFYFVMEDKLGKHLGYTKTEMHDATKDVFLKVAEEDGAVYDSIADIKDEESMMVRIVKFQEWAALEFNYTTEPFMD